MTKVIFEYGDIKIEMLDNNLNTTFIKGSPVHTDETFRPSPLYPFNAWIPKMVALIGFAMLRKGWDCEDGFFESRNSPEMDEYALDDESEDIRVFLYEFEEFYDRDMEFEDYKHMEICEYIKVIEE